MSHKRHSRLIRTVLGAAIAAFAIKASVAQEIWFGPLLPRAPRTHITGIDDWSALLAPDAPWASAARATRFFHLIPGYIAEASDTDITTLVQAMTERGIAFGIGIQPIAVEGNEGCGHTEGYDNPHAVATVVDKAHRLGIPIKYILLDGPLWFGHYATGDQECRFSLDEVITRTLRNIQPYLANYPNAELADVEGVPGSLLQRDWQTNFAYMNAGLESATGHPLKFLALDVAWHNPGWPDAVTRMRQITRSMGMGLGIFYNGDGFDSSDVEWIQHAQRNFIELESEHGLIPDVALFKSWNRFPVRALPENSPQAHTWLIDQYVLDRTHFQIVQRGSREFATLLDAKGHGVPGAKVVVKELGVDPHKSLPEKIIRDTVPSQAEAAVLGIRVNTECFCAGLNDLEIGPIEYKESGTPVSFRFDLAPEAARVGKANEPGLRLDQVEGGPGVFRLHVAPEQNLLINSHEFRVTPGAKFEFRVPIGSLRPEGLFGTVSVIWLPGGKGMSRVNVFDVQDVSILDSIVTDKDGQIALPDHKRALLLDFSGSETLRPALGRVDSAIH